MAQDFSELINTFSDFPKKGIDFKDILPVLQNPNLFGKLIDKMCDSEILKRSEAIIAIDARGFIFGTAIAIKLSKPMIVARKPGKLPGELISQKYELEYGQNSLSIQKDAIDPYQSLAIVDDVIATGGTLKCISDLLTKSGKKIIGASVVIELTKIARKEILKFPVESQITL